MAAAAGIGGLLRSVATKLARAPPPRHRLPALGVGGGFPRCRPSRPFSSASNIKDVTQNKEVVSKWDSANDAAIVKMAYFLAFGGVIYMYGWVLPTLDRINNNLDAAAKARSKREDELIQNIRHEFQKYRESQERRFEATGASANYSEARTSQNSGSISFG
ncbi:hypothetical protein EJB05_01306 [Eragrostis curvula]|uniref:Uncharacterized protein n=1 Tax=Eragrostis curvula TaxID=38414 RepID=A0A5J9WP92_9POAL|nr:hypothetical protein EJB05_01306 [Eragrostis curvula]